MRNLPPVAVMYTAFAERDSTFEGVFYTGVKTTGIFCRPTCKARKPRPENVEYFGTPQEALYAGYRPCLLCKPMDHEKRSPEVVEELCRIMEKAPSGKITAGALKQMGIDPSTARRQFQRCYGMTFNAYQRARRMGLALHQIRGGESVISTQLNHGFESASGFCEAFKNVFGVPPGKSENVKCLRAKWIDTPLGAMLALADGEGLHLLEFVDRRGLENELLALRKRTGCVIVPGNNRHLQTITAELKSYFECGGTKLSVPLVPAGSAFEKAAWAELQTIPGGETRSYPRWQKDWVTRVHPGQLAEPMAATCWRWSSPATASSVLMGPCAGTGAGSGERNGCSSTKKKSLKLHQSSLQVFSVFSPFSV